MREAIRPRFERLLAILRRACPEADERRLHALAFSVVGQCLHYKMAAADHRAADRDRGVRGARPGLPDRPHHAFCLAALGLAPPLGSGWTRRRSAENGDVRGMEAAEGGSHDVMDRAEDAGRATGRSSSGSSWA